MYFEKFGQETALVRIGSCTPQPENIRMLSTWFSQDDFVSLIEAVFRAPVLGCPVIWGASANDADWWDNSHLGFLGWNRRITPKTSDTILWRPHPSRIRQIRWSASRAAFLSTIRSSRRVDDHVRRSGDGGGIACRAGMTYPEAADVNDIFENGEQR